ncbi:response regulator transcription factor [Paenibacillus albiflavus]|uniref:Response regulator transcription factor n=1 Tax=Paenibacillus albiflavus TaxID=2545760 RepID=A0A4R4EHS9_9BACL|nr:response regulator transcription factor [Paenibacillus albiflavus]TCZ77738.1 response regulator transcription factor [Paenibacillus albiflavus]
MSSVIKVMLVDDHEMVRAGLKMYITLDSRFTIVAEASNGQEAVNLLQSMNPDDRPDVMLLDLSMPVMNGIETAREVGENYPQIKVVMLTSFLEEEKVVQAIEAGAISYILKTVSSDQLIEVIANAAAGIPTINSEISMALTRGLRQRTKEEDTDGLTLREREVLTLIADGRTNKEIAEALFISIKTVKTHVSNLLMKCELEDRTQLAVYAHRKGWASTAK